MSPPFGGATLGNFCHFLELRIEVEDSDSQAEFVVIQFLAEQYVPEVRMNE
jgi:hypothetical protein